MIFAHGSGDSRHRPGNRHVAGVPNGAGPGTLLSGLLTPEEELGRATVSGIGLLAGRLAKSSPAGCLAQRFGVAPRQAHGRR